jgi:hypothetical protein
MVLPVVAAERPDYFPQNVGDSHTYKSAYATWTDNITGLHEGCYVHSNYWAGNVPSNLTFNATGDVVQMMHASKVPAGT